MPAAAQREVLTASSLASAGSNTLRVPWRPTSVGRVRRALVQDLQSRGVPPTTIDESEIVVSELLSNAIRHASPRPAPRAVWAPSGRGLRIVRSLAHEWGVADDRHGSTVWASLGGPSRRRSR